jgi:hypothetical protein
VVEDKKFYGHTFILIARCPAFYEDLLLANEATPPSFREFLTHKQKLELKVKETHPAVFFAFLFFIYSDSLDEKHWDALTEGEKTELYSLATHYNLET